jgi:hypothetical protein
MAERRGVPVEAQVVRRVVSGTPLLSRDGIEETPC